MLIREFNPLDYMDQIGPLLSANWAETGFDFPLELNRELYSKAHEAGLLICLGLFDGAELVGYCTGMVSPHLFNPEVKLYVVDALYVRDDHRGVQAARLILDTERTARERGATHLMWMTRAGTPLHTTFAKRGYELADISMIRRL